MATVPAKPTRTPAKRAKYSGKSLILDLCGGTGSWSSPYRESGLYDVHTITLPTKDIRLFHFPKRRVHGILAAPPCTHLAVSGARWWSTKGPNALLEALAITDACLRLVVVCKPKFWALENPVGRLSAYLGPPVLTFDPCDYGDPYTKRTCLWGDFVIPIKSPVVATEGSKMHLLPPNSERQILRSITPAGFALAFFKANP